MNQNCFICNLPIGISARNCVNIFAENITHSAKKLHEVIAEVIETEVTDTPGRSSVVCKKCQKACTEYDALTARVKTIKSELQDSYRRTQINQRNSKPSETPPKTPIKETRKIVLPASKLQPLPPNYLIEMGKFPKIESVGSLMPDGFYKLANNIKVSANSQVFNQNAKIVTSSPIKILPSNIISSPSKITDTNISGKAITSLMMPNQNQTKITKNPVMSFNVNLPKDFLTTDDGKDVKKEIVITANLDDGENNDDHPMEIDEDCTLAVVPSTDENGKLVYEVDLKKANSNFFDVGLLLEGDNETRSSDREEKFILDKLQILNENLDDDDDESQEIVLEESSEGDGGRIISLVSADDGNDAHDSNDESQIELQVSGDEETANAIIAAAQERGGAFIKVESGEMYRVKSVRSSTPTHEIPDIVAQHNTQGQFKCLLCEKSTTGDGDPKPTLSGDAEFMMYHLKTSHGARLYICQLCGDVVRRRSEYAKHIEEHAQKNKSTGNKTRLHSCSVCGKAYNSRTLLSEHMNTHSGRRPYSCDTCDKAFASKYTLQAHMKTHQDRPRPFKCSSCGKAFLTQQNLTQHEKTHSGVKEFVCKVCNKAFATQHNLEVHCVVHTGKKPFFCSVCDKGFARRAEVKDHMRTHTGERPFPCELCGATFAQRSNLHSHKRATHFDDKRYQCNHCTKRFKRRRLLDYHLKAAHTGERPLKCDICRATFVYPEHYKKHVRIHSGERPFVCEVCGKSFNSRDNRNMHRFVHSDKKPYECLTCGAGYMRKQLLYTHMNTTGHVAESIVVNQPKVITAVENVFETTTELELDGNEVHTVEGDGTKLFLTETDDKKIEIKQSDINILQNVEESTLLTLQDFIEANPEDDQTQLVTTDDKGNTMRLIPVQLADGKSGWVAINNT